MRAAAIMVVVAAGCSGELTPEGDIHRYVVSSVLLPRFANDVPSFAIPLDDTDRPLNQFGLAFAGTVPFDQIFTRTIETGGASLLIELQTRDFTEAAASGVRLRFGDNPSPTPCSAPTTCGRHLTGTGSFDVAFDSPEEDAMFGSVRGGVFLSTLGGATSIVVSLDGERGFEIPLLAARIKLANVTEDRIATGVIAGAIPRDFVIDRLIGALDSDTIAPLIEDCETTGSACQCSPGSLGLLIATAFDTDGNCLLLRDELEAHPGVMDVQRSDIDIDGTPGVTFGIGFSANRAEF